MQWVEADWLATCDGDEFRSPLANSCLKSRPFITRSLASLHKVNKGDAVHMEKEQLYSLLQLIDQVESKHTVGRVGAVNYGVDTKGRTAKNKDSRPRQTEAL